MQFNTHADTLFKLLSSTYSVQTVANTLTGLKDWPYMMLNWKGKIALVHHIQQPAANPLSDDNPELAYVTGLTG